MANNIDSRVRAFFTTYPRISLRKGVVLIDADENPSGVFYIDEGFVKQYNVTIRGEVLMLTIFKPGAFIPLTWGLNETTNKSTFESLTEVVAYRAPREEVISFLTKNPDILLDRTKRLLLGISGLLGRMETIVLDSAYEKVVRVLDYFDKTFGPSIPFSLPHKELAAWTGLARETVSLQIEELRKRGVVEYEGRQLKINSEKLSKELTLRES